MSKGPHKNPVEAMKKVNVGFERGTLERVTAIANKHGVPVRSLIREMVKRQLEAIS